MASKDTSIDLMQETRIEAPEETAAEKQGFITKHSGLALEISNGSLEAGAHLIQSRWHGGNSQLFRLGPLIDGRYRPIVCAHSNMVLSVADESMQDRAHIIQLPWENKLNQQFLIENLPDESLRLTARHSGKVLDVEWADLQPGAHLIQFYWHGGNNQKFMIRQATGYDPRNIRAWDGLYGVTAAYARGDNLLIVSQDKFWRWNPTQGFYANGFLGEAWGERTPIIDLNPPGSQHSRLQKRPWNYPGVTAIFYFRNDTDVHYASRNKYWVFSWVSGQWGAGWLRDLLPNAPVIDGRGPFDGPGLTGSYRVGNVLRLISADRLWRYDVTTNQWVNWGYLRDIWASIPTIDGVHPWDGAGVTCAYYYPPKNETTIISRDKYWVFDYGQNNWTSWGYLADRWADMPGIDGGWTQPIARDAPSDWRISLRMGALGTGQGHLGHDIERREGHALSVGQEISAAAQGKIVTILPSCGSYFNVVIIEHMVPDIDDIHSPIYSFYGHMHATSGLREGQWVRRGEVIGRLADPYTLPSPPYDHFDAHLHFEIKNWAALIEMPFSTCYCLIPDNQRAGRYISAGYTGYLFPEPSEYHDMPQPAPQRCDGTPPMNRSVPRRYYNPTKFVERRGGDPLGV